MMKLFRVHHVHANGLETLALTVSAGGLKSAVKRVREHPLIRLPNGTYYIFEAGNYSDGLQITFSGSRGGQPYVKPYHYDRPPGCRP